MMGCTRTRRATRLWAHSRSRLSQLHQRRRNKQQERSTTRMRFKIQAAVVLVTLFAAACVSGPQGQNSSGKKTRSGPLRIGLSLDTLKEERWQYDRDLFLARAKELGAEVLVQSANSDDAVQTQQAENLLTQGVDVLVIVAHNAEVAASIVDSAKKQ